jgi:peroxiredoxin (alkyl hydroperoxide reductase subunit C)
MLTIGDTFPAFSLNALVGLEPGAEFETISFAPKTGDATSEDKGPWRVFFFWPMDFTFVCPTELAAFGQRHADFRERHALVYGASTDSHYVHLAWRQHHPALRELPYPMLADIKRELSGALGILHRDEGVALRATFIVDPRGVIRHVSVYDLNVGRNVDETLRVLDALQTDELCPCNWVKGEATL